MDKQAMVLQFKQGDLLHITDVERIAYGKQMWSNGDIVEVRNVETGSEGYNRLEVWDTRKYLSEYIYPEEFEGFERFGGYILSRWAIRDKRLVGVNEQSRQRDISEPGYDDVDVKFGQEMGLGDITGEEQNNGYYGMPHPDELEFGKKPNLGGL